MNIVFVSSLFSRSFGHRRGLISGLALHESTRIRHGVRVAVLLAGLQKTRGNRKLRLASESIIRYLSNAGPTRARSKRFVRCRDFFRVCDVARSQNGPFLMAPAWHSKDISVVKDSANNLSTFNNYCSLFFYCRLYIALVCSVCCRVIIFLSLFTQKEQLMYIKALARCRSENNYVGQSK